MWYQHSYPEQDDHQRRQSGLCAITSPLWLQVKTHAFGGGVVDGAGMCRSLSQITQDLDQVS